MALVGFDPWLSSFLSRRCTIMLYNTQQLDDAIIRFYTAHAYTSIMTSIIRAATAESRAWRHARSVMRESWSYVDALFSKNTFIDWL